MEEGVEDAFVGSGVEEAGFVAVSQPVGDLFDGGLSEVVGEDGLAGVSDQRERRKCGERAATSSESQSPNFL